MTLKNLLGISLESVTPDKAQVQRLLVAAARNLTDAQLTALSPENQFDLAYKAVMQLASCALLAHGYRTLTSKPGHHATVIQSLPLTVGLPPEDMVMLDALRKQRNLSDYSGDLVSETTARECILTAQKLQRLVHEWLAANRSESL